MSSAVLNEVDNDGDFVRVVRVRAERAHSLLDEKSKRLRRAGKNNGLATRHVESFAEKVGVAEDFDMPVAKVVYEAVSDERLSIAVTMSGGDTGVVKSIGNGFRVVDVDAVADSGLSVGVIKVSLNDVTDNFF